MGKKEKEFLSAYDKHADALFRFCFLRTSDRELAKDLVQETFLKAWGYVERGDSIEQFQPFLYRIAGNLVIDWYRKRKPDSLDALTEAGFEPADGREDAATKAEVEEALRMIQKLSPDDQQIIHLRYIEGYDIPEIVRLLRENENVVSVRLHRALKRFRKTFK